MSLPRVDLENAVAITSNPVVTNDNRTGAIQVFVQGADGQVNHLYVCPLYQPCSQAPPTGVMVAMLASKLPDSFILLVVPGSKFRR